MPDCFAENWVWRWQITGSLYIDMADAFIAKYKENRPGRKRVLRNVSALKAPVPVAVASEEALPSKGLQGRVLSNSGVDAEAFRKLLVSRSTKPSAMPAEEEVDVNN